MTDALQQRSLYQCALMKRMHLPKGNSLQGSKLRRMKFPVIPLLVLERRYYGDCSWKFTEDSFKTKDMDKNTCK